MGVNFRLRFCVFFWMVASYLRPSLTFHFEQAIARYEEHLERYVFVKFLKKAGWSWQSWLELKEAADKLDNQPKP